MAMIHDVLVKSNTACPGFDFCGDEIVGGKMGTATPLIRVGNLLLAPVAKQEGFAAGGGVEGDDVVQVVLLHDEDEIGPAGMALGNLAGAVPGHGHAKLLDEGQGGIIGGVIHQGANTGGLHLDCTPCGNEFVPQQVFGNRAAADVARADGEDFLEHE